MLIKQADRGSDLGVVLTKTLMNDWEPQKRTAGFRGLGFNNKGDDDIKKIIAYASEAEILSLPRKYQEEIDILKVINTKVAEGKYAMQVLDLEYQFDRHKLTIFYTAEARVDFRDLVRDLFCQFKTRIWMQQVDPLAVESKIDTAGNTLSKAAGFFG